MIFSAVFFPSPFTALRRLTSAVATADTTSSPLSTDKMAIPIFGPTPDTEMSFKNNSFSLSEENPKSIMPSSLTCK